MNEGLQRSEDKIARLSHLLELSRVIQYLKDHEREEGGFSLIPELQSNVEDTYNAIRTLRVLEADIDLSKIKNYMKSIPWAEVGSPRIFYMVAYICLSTGAKFPAPLVHLLEKDWSRFDPLDSQYFFNEIQKLLGKSLRLLPSLSSFQFHPKDSLQSLRKKVSVLLDLNIEFERHEIIKWVQLCQNGDGGFGFYPGTTSYMENIFCALEILSKLQASPQRIDTCREYILGCQTRSGGFGRAPISFPFIESTFQAVGGLLMLDEMERGHT